MCRHGRKTQKLLKTDPLTMLSGFPELRNGFFGVNLFDFRVLA